MSSKSNFRYWDFERDPDARAENSYWNSKKAMKDMYGVDTDEELEDAEDDDDYDFDDD